MRSIKVMKMNLRQIIKPAIYYYIIFIAIIMAIITTVKGNINGMELATVIFIFVCGLNSFKSNFYFAKSCGVSRKAFMGGILLSALPIAFIMSIIDQILIRVFNIFIRIPNIYEEIYKASDMVFFRGSILEAFIVIMAYVLGVAITMLYYRCNKVMKVVISVVPIVLINLTNLSDRITLKIGAFLANNLAVIFGYKSCNVYLGVLSLGVITAVLGALTFVMVHKAVVKR